MIIIILIGPPGCGKGTCAQMINERFGLQHVSTGDILRSVCNSGSEEGSKIKTILDSGELVSDELMLKLISEHIKNNISCKGFMFDGFPRTNVQADGLECILNQHHLKLSRVFCFNVNPDALVDRVCGRLVHPASGRVYHVKNRPPKVEGIDDVSGEPLITRADDKEDVIRKRIELYEVNTQPLIRYYETKKLVTEINANRSISEVLEQIKEHIDSLK